MFEVCLIWGGELIVHKADSFVECGEWIDSYSKVPVTNVRVWFGNVLISKGMCY